MVAGPAVKKPCILWKKPYIVWTKPHFHKSCVSCVGSYVSLKIETQKRDLYYSKTDPQKRPTLFKQRTAKHTCQKDTWIRPVLYATCLCIVFENTMHSIYICTQYTCMYIYTEIYIYVTICMYMCVHVYIYIYICIYIYTKVYMYIYMYIHVYTQFTYMCTKWAYVFTVWKEWCSWYIYTDMNIYNYVYLYIYIHVYT